MDQLGSIIGGAAIWTLLIVGGIRLARRVKK
jgi:hypothetical protein